MSELSFEDAIEKLEKIVEELENNKLPLEEAIAKFEEGMKLSKLCDLSLNKAQARLTELSEGDEETAFIPDRDLE